MSKNVIDLGNNSWIRVTKLSSKVLESINFDDLWNQHPERVGRVKMYDKWVDTPRFHQSFLKSYRFTGQELEAKEPCEQLVRIKKIIDEKLGYGQFDQVLVNWYRSGLDYIGAHSDDERQIIPNSEIVSISLGATRKFRIRDKKTKAIIRDIDMQNGLILVMGGEMQKHFTHEVVKVAGKKGEEIGRRINITFRKWAN